MKMTSLMESTLLGLVKFYNTCPWWILTCLSCPTVNLKPQLNLSNNSGTLFIWQLILAVPKPLVFPSYSCHLSNSVSHAVWYNRLCWVSKCACMRVKFVKGYAKKFLLGSVILNGPGIGIGLNRNTHPMALLCKRTFYYGNFRLIKSFGPLLPPCR